MKDSMITTEPELAGYEIEESLGIVTGLIVRSTSRISRITGSREALSGGNNATYTKLCRDARRQSFDEMYMNAIKIGANAIISVKHDATNVGDMAEVLSYGTAVVVRPKANSNA